MSRASNESDDLQQRLVDGDEDALTELFSRHRERLCVRIDQRLTGRIDPEDVLQKA